MDVFKNLKIYFVIKNIIKSMTAMSMIKIIELKISIKSCLFSRVLINSSFSACSKLSDIPMLSRTRKNAIIFIKINTMKEIKPVFFENFIL
mgnify:CR=1 FL=1